MKWFLCDNVYLGDVCVCESFCYVLVQVHAGQMIYDAGQTSMLMLKI